MGVGSEQELRAARNQAVYREVNEKIESLHQAFGEALAAGSTWVCECADRECTQPIEMTLGEYEQLRAHPNRFAVLDGHVSPEVERVVAEHDGYVIVEKLGAAEAYAVEHDPRAPERSS